MEKRLLLAFLLSFLVLSIWSRLAPRPTTPTDNLTQNVERQDVVPAEQKKAASETRQVSTDPEPVPAEEEETTTLENDFLLAAFTNMGGSLDSVELKEYGGATLPIKDIFAVKQFNNTAFAVESATSKRIVYRHARGGLVVRKIYELGRDYIVRASIELQRKSSDTPSSLEMNAFTMDISRMDNTGGDGRDKSLYEYSIAGEKNVHRKGNAYKFGSKETAIEPGPVKWIGFRDRYFCAVFKPEFHVETYKIDNINEETQSISALSEAPAGQNSSYGGILFFGPQKLELLKSYEIGLDEIMIFSNWGIMDGISKAIYSIMHWLYNIIPNWGVCIIIVSLLIYGAMYPLTMKGMSSMKKMQSLQPKITTLREQHKHNPQKLNKEIMELYQKHKINPLGGCFPLLLQMPVFIGLYQVLWRSVAFKGSDFLWIKDLSEPDRLFTLPSKLPLIGNEINILPIVMIIVMVFQQKLSSKNMVVTDPAQASQQKMMMTIFPLFIGFIFYKFASGLCLYFTIFYILSTFTQWKMSKVTHAIS